MATTNQLRTALSSCFSRYRDTLLAEAIDAYKRALALEPDHALAMFDLGGTYWNLEDREKALEVWSEACKRFPKDENVRRVVAMLR